MWNETNALQKQQRINRIRIKLRKQNIKTINCGGITLTGDPKKTKVIKSQNLNMCSRYIHKYINPTYVYSNLT